MKRGAPNRLPDELVTRMYSDYQNTGSMVRAAALHGRSEVTLLGIFRGRGLPTLGDRGARGAQTRRAHLDDLVVKMHAEYMRGLSLGQVGKRFGGRTYKTVRGLFMARGLFIRPSPGMAKRKFRADGRFEPYVPHTAAEIEALIAAETKLRVPPALKLEWRHWSLAQRGEFIARLRAKLGSPHDRPEAPFSKGLEPFDYASPRAQAIMDAMNVGRDARGARMKLNICSQGVIFRGQLWFWAHEVGYARGPWTPEEGRPVLHHVLWTERHGPVPPAYVVRFADGNRNNHAPANLVLASRNELCRENQAAALLHKSRERTALLLARSTQPKTHDRDLLDRLTR